jgi:NAD(P)H-hydrate epimerase
VLGAVFEAHHTFTFGFAKLGLVGDPGCRHVGTLRVIDIGIPRRIADRERPSATVIDSQEVSRRLNVRPRHGHKGTFGHLLICAGSPGKMGAAWLCGEGAMRSGVGLCTLAVTPEDAKLFAPRMRETMLAIAPVTSPVVDGKTYFDWVAKQFKGKSAVAVGPGLSIHTRTTAFVKKMVSECPLPLVVDADALNVLAADPKIFKRAKAAIVVTPHPGEMARLMRMSTSEIQANRCAAAASFARQYNVCVVLKGARSVVATAAGNMWINPSGNSGMGSGGMGDVLTGMIGALLAQGLSAEDAAVVATYAHGHAGDRAAEKNSKRALIARDLLSALPSTWSTFE